MATAAGSDERVELTLSTKYLVLMFVLGWITFFVTLIIAFVTARKYIRFVDRDGVTMRNGMRLPFKELTSAGTKQVGIYTQYYLAFGATEVAMWPFAPNNCDAAMALVQRAIEEGRTKQVA
jgi:hypothetical protein